LRFGGGGAFTGMALEYPNAWAISGGSAPPTIRRRKRERRKRNAIHSVITRELPGYSA
jgi:hypothetical protein